MTMIAFLGDPAIKELALSRLRAHFEAGTFRFNPAWSDKGASALGSVVESDDPDAYAEAMGFPVPLALALDKIINGLEDLNEGKVFAQAWLERTPVGADLANVVGETLVYILELEQVVDVARRVPAIENARIEVIDLHRRALAGEEVGRKDWKSVRTGAMLATAGVAEDRVLRAASLIVEAAAWPGSMRTVLTDTRNELTGLDMRQTLAEIGWSDDDERRVFAAMEIAEQRNKDPEGGMEVVFAILAEDDPAFADRARERGAQARNFSRSNPAVAQFILSRLASAPVTNAPIEHEA
jgi:hypothetical protein